MLTIEQFKLKYPGEFCWGNVGKANIYSGIKLIMEGMLQFTAETACSWGGPLYDNYAQFVLDDWSEATFTSGPNKGKKVLHVWDLNDKLLEAKCIRRGIKHEKYIQRANLNKPIKLWIFGNDDTSYSKFYSSTEEAVNELNLFIANEPLEFDIVYDFGFVFTN